MANHRPLPDSVPSRALRAVVSLGECTIDEVEARVGQFIPASRAAASGRYVRRHATDYRRRKCPTAAPTGRAPGNKLTAEAVGRRRIVSQALGRLARGGKIRRVGPGVYAPLKPKVYEPPQWNGNRVNEVG